MKIKLTIFTLLMLSNIALGQEKTKENERSLNSESNTTIQPDSVRTEISTERTLQTRKESKKQEKQPKVKNERAIRNDE